MKVGKQMVKFSRDTQPTNTPGAEITGAGAMILSGSAVQQLA